MSEFTEHLHEVFTLFGPVSARKMFGGYGIYHDGVMFGLVTDDTLYLKADASNRDQFLARGLGPFEYEKNGKRIALSFYLAPEEILEDPEAARAWAKKSWEVAWRARSKRGKSQRRRD